MADPVGTPLAALGTAEQCIKLAAKLRRKYNDYKTAEHSLRELILILESHAVTIESQVAFLRSVWSSIEDRLQNLYNTLLHTLYHKLQYAIELVDAAIGVRQEQPSSQSVLAKQGPVRRLYFAFSLKKCLQKTVNDLEMWHKRFDPSWYMISRISDSVVDGSFQRHSESKSVSILRNLRASASQHQDGKAPTQELLDPNVLTGAVTRRNAGFGIELSRIGSGGDIIIEQFVPHQRASQQRTQDVILRLASILADVDPQIFGLLQCYGVVLHSPSTSAPTLPIYNILFGVPPGMIKPTLLRTRLARSQPASLNVRLSLARSLSNAVMFVHCSTFVHKNIRPETILTFESAASTTPIPYLIGFEYFRLANGETFKTGDTQWERNLYRHPKRQGFRPEEEYNMLHDVYSLGVVLLEVGLWTSFVAYNDTRLRLGSGNNSSGEPIAVTDTDAAAAMATGPNLGPALTSLASLIVTANRENAAMIKTFLVDLARNQLPYTMGDKYTQIVVRCLTCLDTEDPGLGDPDEFLDQDDVVVGVEFVESVIMELYEVSY